MIEHPFFQQYRGYTENENAYFIFSNYIRGMDVFHFLKELSKTKWGNRLSLLAYRIRYGYQDSQILHWADHLDAGVLTLLRNRLPRPEA